MKKKKLAKSLRELNYKNYFFKHNLDKFFRKDEISFKHIKYKFDYIFKNNNKKSYPPELLDLIRLHYLIISRKVTTILEFGVGFSSLIMADALKINEKKYGLYVRNNLRRGNAFELHSVDTSKKYIKITKNRIPKSLKNKIFMNHSDAHMTKFNGQICAEFKKIPNICPDLIYVDGPSFMHVKGSKNGIHTRHIDRTIISSDLLKIESFLLPGTLIIWDGLTSYARFIEKNFRRKWRFEHLPDLDITLAEQVEEPLGIYNKKQLEFCLGKKR